MLKTKLHKAGFIITSFMLMAAASGNKSITPVEIKTETVAKPGDSLVITKHIFDTTGLCTCLPALTEAALETAPRIYLQEEARSFVTTHLKENAFYYDKIKAKSKPVFSIIDQIFNEYQIPVELKYLAIVESKLDSRITSSAGAAGLWQFIPVAAKSFGLRINGKQDDRRNEYKSTVAAAKCLLYLNGIFDDWLLTLAAYNSGPAKVLSAIRKSGSRNYWELEKWLPAETRKHVKKFISVHYHFEGHGSLVTMTKVETQTHTAAVNLFRKQTENPTDSLPVQSAVFTTKER
jgi:membrane-bound lytic murein transglycosylase D